MQVWQLLLIIVVVVAAVLAVLYFLGKRAEKKTERTAGADRSRKADRLHADY